MKKLNGYQIQTQDRNNAFTDDKTQAFDTLEEARGWVDAVLEYKSSLGRRRRVAHKERFNNCILY